MLDIKDTQLTIAKTIEAPLADLQLVLSEVKRCNLYAEIKNKESEPEKSPVMKLFRKSVWR